MTIQIKKEGRTTLLMTAELEKHITPFWFDLNAWQEHGAVLGSAPGRGQSYFLRWLNPESSVELALVWRHYRRGGLIAKLSDDAYVYTGLTQTRPYKEFSLTEKLYQAGLPVPRPIAAAVHRHGLLYRADFITEQLPNTQSMASRLAQPECELPWEAIGKMIKRFHSTGLDHVDLNIRNILIDQNNQPFLIDFDRCILRPVEHQARTLTPWQHSNLQRLQRSIDKEFTSTAIDLGFAKLTNAYHGN